MLEMDRMYTNILKADLGGNNGKAQETDAGVLHYDDGGIECIITSTGCGNRVKRSPAVSRAPYFFKPAIYLSG
jgi:hypothetical protein